MKLCLLKFLLRMNVPLWPAESVLRFCMRLLWIYEVIDNAFLLTTSSRGEPKTADLAVSSSFAPILVFWGAPCTL